MTDEHFNETVEAVAADEELASRWKRLGAALIDSFLAIAVFIPLLQAMGIWDSLMQGIEPSFETNMQLGIIAIVLFLAMHGYLLAKYGQTIGKKLLGIRIVSLENELPEFGGLILKRYVPQWIVVNIPGISILSLVDVLFIFRADKRCVHDLIAGTKVINC